MLKSGTETPQKYSAGLNRTLSRTSGTARDLLTVRATPKNSSSVSDIIKTSIQACSVILYA